MTLEQAVKRLAEKGMWFWYDSAEVAGSKRWVVCRGATQYEYEHDGMAWVHVAAGITWQEAYAAAMNEAPF